MKNVYSCVCVLALSALFQAGCAVAPSAAWLNDFNAAKKIAARQNKNILLFFSADDDTESARFKESVCGAPDFLEAIRADYVPVNLDFSRALYEKTEIPEGAEANKRTEVNKLRAALDRNSELASLYDVWEMPAFLLLTKEGYVISALDISGSPEAEEGAESAAPLTAEQLLALIAAQKEHADAVNGQVKKIGASSGADKARAISEFYEATPEEYQQATHDLWDAAISADPGNKSGALGKFEMQNAYRHRNAYRATRDYQAVADEFSRIAGGGHLNAAERQEAWYMAASALNQSDSKSYEAILDYLAKSVAADPESDHAPQIQETITFVEEESAAAAKEAAQKEAETAQTDAP